MNEKRRDNRERTGKNERRPERRADRFAQRQEVVEEVLLEGPAELIKEYEI